MIRLVGVISIIEHCWACYACTWLPFGCAALAGSQVCADAVLTSGRCCVSNTPDLMTHGIYVTIGFTEEVKDVFTIQAEGSWPDTINEFVSRVSGSLITHPLFSPETVSSSRPPELTPLANVWDICLIKLMRDYSVDTDGPDIGKALSTFLGWTEDNPIIRSHQRLQ